MERHDKEIVTATGESFGDLKDRLYVDERSN